VNEDLKRSEPRVEPSVPCVEDGDLPQSESGAQSSLHSGRTPGHWVAYSEEGERHGRSEHSVCRHVVGAFPHVCIASVWGQDSDEAKANADFIVKAVNCHEELLQCLKETGDALGALVTACSTKDFTAEGALRLWQLAMSHNADLETRVNVVTAKAEGR